jgi:hypothetical protein
VSSESQDQPARDLEHPLHTRERFEFVANAPLQIAWPLFGAHKERHWAPGWDPIFLWPAQAGDQEGMVFKVKQGGNTAVWVNTDFDRTANRIQYVYVIPGVVVTVITLRLAPQGQSTGVEVIYERTALANTANELVGQMAAHDRAAGREWSRQINAYLDQSHCTINITKPQIATAHTAVRT